LQLRPTKPYRGNPFFCEKLCASQKLQRWQNGSNLKARADLVSAPHRRPAFVIPLTNAFCAKGTPRPFQQSPTRAGNRATPFGTRIDHLANALSPVRVSKPIGVVVCVSIAMELPYRIAVRRHRINAEEQSELWIVIP